MMRSHLFSGPRMLQVKCMTMAHVWIRSGHLTLLVPIHFRTYFKAAKLTLRCILRTYYRDMRAILHL